MSLTIGSLFSGVGGIELGLERAGLGPVLWQVEKDPFCRQVLAKHWPGVARFEDVTTVEQLPHVAIICGGFPCTDLSSAGLGAGIYEGERSALWWHFAAVIESVGPHVVVIENVASAKRRWLPAVRQTLHMLGYHSTAFALSAADVGAPHRRSRVFIVAHVDGVSLRVEQQRRSGRRARVVRDAGKTVFGVDGGARLDTHADAAGCVQLADSEQGTQGQGGDTAAGCDPSVGRYWDVEPDVVRVVRWAPDGVDRIAALGNIAVPACAQVIGRIVAEALAGVA